MSERTSYEPGTPCWVDLGTPDIEAAASFYGDLFGWDVPEQPNSEQVGGYRRAQKDGADVAGAMPLMQEGQPPAWTMYISVADADATAEAVTANGGTQIAAPMDVMDLGRMALFTDPEGAFFGIWQAGTFPGAARVNEPGSLSWNELETRDPAAAKRFYGAVFGWQFEEENMPGGMTYNVAKLGDARVAGMADIKGRVPDQVLAHWMAYFSVDDAEGAIGKVEAGGGSVTFGPIDIPVGRFAMVADPWGANFAVVKHSEETAASAP